MWVLDESEPVTPELLSALQTQPKPLTPYRGDVVKAGMVCRDRNGNVALRVAEAFDQRMALLSFEPSPQDRTPPLVQPPER